MRFTKAFLLFFPLIIAITQTHAQKSGLPPIIDRELRTLGYQHVTLDVRGYRLGSLNEALRLRPV